MWCISVPSLFMGFVTMMAVRYWASLTTNRKLLGQLFKLYVVAMALIFMFTLWTACVLFLTFSSIKRWGVSCDSCLNIVLSSVAHVAQCHSGHHLPLLRLHYHLPTSLPGNPPPVHAGCVVPRR